MTRQVFLVAADADGMAALRPTRETLDVFSVTWVEILLAAADAGTLERRGGARALIVASSDAGLPDALASATELPVVRVPTADAERAGSALLYDPSSADLPAGEATFATVAIGEAGAKNAALFVVSMLGLTDASLWEKWLAFRQRQTDAVLAASPLSLS